jgi:hypothetical protein
VTRALFFLAGLALAIVVFAGTGAQAALTRQSIGFVLQRDAAHTERLPFYRSASPIAVNVRGDAAHLSAITVTATGPGGTAINAPLVRDGDTFTGALHLVQPGTWTLALTTQLGSVSAALGAVPLNVVAEDNVDLAARLAFVLAALSVGGGLTLIVVRARRSARRGGVSA